MPIVEPKLQSNEMRIQFIDKKIRSDSMDWVLQGVHSQNTDQKSLQIMRTPML